VSGSPNKRVSRFRKVSAPRAETWGTGSRRECLQAAGFVEDILGHRREHRSGGVKEQPQALYSRAAEEGFLSLAYGRFLQRRERGHAGLIEVPAQAGRYQLGASILVQHAPKSIQKTGSASPRILRGGGYAICPRHTSCGEVIATVSMFILGMRVVVEGLGSEEERMKSLRRRRCSVIRRPGATIAWSKLPDAAAEFH